MMTKKEYAVIRTVINKLHDGPKGLDYHYWVTTYAISELNKLMPDNERVVFAKAATTIPPKYASGGLVPKIINLYKPTTIKVVIE